MADAVVKFAKQYAMSVSPTTVLAQARIKIDRQILQFERQENCSTPVKRRKRPAQMRSLQMEAP